MVIYSCDGSSKEGSVGVGIVRKKKRGFSYFQKRFRIDGEKNLHELVAIHQTLSMIEKQEEKEVMIFTDDTEIIGFLDSKNPKRFKRKKQLTTVPIRLKRMKEKGFVISIQSIHHFRWEIGKINDLAFHDSSRMHYQAHCLSRK